ncbi:MAG: NAD(P)/FAD-dependent oxidoreductase [Solirubrobacterales bacterium]|nr:NAD(P)/FAD-dependent oxidoreductase [Solirubrobacterales bacterium]
MRASDDQRVCVIGAGASGIAACQVLGARGIAFDCFEKGSDIGGNWRYMNDNGVSSAYRSLHINTSRSQMAYATFPMPDEYPDYPNHFQIARYFDDYADHFGLRDRISFRTEVISVVPEGAPGRDAEEAPLDAGYVVAWRDADGNQGSATYRAVLVANGHHWDARWPEPAFPGSGSFGGEQIHVHDYKEREVLEGKRVLVLGIGNSATDIAVEASLVADATFLAMRRGAYIVPKFINGRPTDEASPAIFSRLPLAIQRRFFMRALRVSQGDVTNYGLPEPDHKLLEAHPTVSSDLLPRLGQGNITVKPNIARFEGRDVVFDDGSREPIDLVVYCTGYRISFPFFDPGFVSAPGNRLPLYRLVVHPDHPGLYFIGLAQPLGAIMPIAELQSEWVADILEGACELPGAERMRAAIEREKKRMAKRYVASSRHTIQVDFDPYIRALQKERRGGSRVVPSTRRAARRSRRAQPDQRDREAPR